MEPKMYKVTTFFETKEIWLTKSEVGGKKKTLRVQAWCEDGPFATITVELSRGDAKDNLAYVDVNNCPWAPDFLKKNGLAVDTGKIEFSGFCAFPLYRFNVDKI